MGKQLHDLGPPTHQDPAVRHVGLDCTTSNPGLFPICSAGAPGDARDHVGGASRLIASIRHPELEGLRQCCAKMDAIGKRHAALDCKVLCAEPAVIADCLLLLDGLAVATQIARHFVSHHGSNQQEALRIPLGNIIDAKRQCTAIIICLSFWNIA